MTPDGGAGGTRPLEVIRFLLTIATAFATLCLAAAWLLAWIPSWPLTLFEHFRVQYCVTGAVIVAATAALRMRGFLDAAAIATLLHLLPITADLTAAPRPVPATGTPLRVLVLNVHTESSGFDQVRELIADENPDLIGLVEVDHRWLAAIAPAVAAYPAHLEEPRGDNFGIALYARGELHGAIERLGGSLPTIVADATIASARFHLILTHPVPPISDSNFLEQQAQLDAIATRAVSLPAPLLVIGDLNTTPWSRGFLRLLQRTQLCDSRAGFGIQASYPATSTILRIPIDHLLASCSVGVRDRRIARDVGSDHLPVILDLTIPPRS